MQLSFFGINFAKNIFEYISYFLWHLAQSIVNFPKEAFNLCL